MNSEKDVTPAVMAVWAARNLPARLDVMATAKLLGFADHDIPILMVTGKLTPLGDPAANAPKWFAAVEVIRRATDEAWLHKATREVAKYWRHKRERQQNSRPSRHSGNRRSTEGPLGRVPPEFSPKSACDEDRDGNGRVEGRIPFRHDTISPSSVCAQ